MMASITNLTSGPLWLPLNSRTSMRLSPGQTLEVAEVEIRDNPYIRKLRAQSHIAVHDGEEEDQGSVAGDETPGSDPGAPETTAARHGAESHQGGSRRATRATD